MLFSSSAWPTQQSSAVDVVVAAAGDLDPTFGTGGKVTTNFFGFGAIAFGVVIQPDGKIVTAGAAGTSETAGHFALARFNPNGTFDPTFGNQGRVSTDFGGFGDTAFSMALQGDGKIVAGGALLIILQPDGRIVAAGVASNLSPDHNRDFGIARYEQFTNCGKGIILIGIGRITNLGCKITLQDAGPIPKRPDRSVAVQVNRCTHTASASILIFSKGRRSESRIAILRTTPARVGEAWR